LSVSGVILFSDYLKEPRAVVEINDIGDSSQCELCEAIAKQLEALITQNSTQVIHGTFKIAIFLVFTHY
jgi:hypothetical protein